MLSINVKLTVITLSLTPIYIILVRLSSKNLHKYSMTSLENGSILNGEFFEILNNIEDIKINNTSDFYINRFSTKQENFSIENIKLNNVTTLFTENFSVISSVCTIILLIISYTMILNNSLSIGVYISISMYASKVFASIQSIANLNITVKPVLAASNRIFEFMEICRENSTGNLQLIKLDTILLNKVCFSYNEELLFKDLTVKFENGDKILIKGENGVGKTSLLKLIVGLYKPTIGEVKLGNIHLDDISRESLSNKVKYISNNTAIISGTVLDNILYSNETKTSEDVKSFLELHNLSRLLKNFSNGLDTLINEDKTGLSLGQLQILSFLRGIISDKDLIILDEPFSHLDTLNKLIISDFLSNYNKANIMLIISHHEENLKFINKAYMVENKKLVEYAL